MSSKNRHWLTDSHPYPFGLFLIILGFVGVGTTGSVFISLLVVALGVFLLFVGHLQRVRERQQRSTKTPPPK